MVGLLTRSSREQICFDLFIAVAAPTLDSPYDSRPYMCLLWHSEVTSEGSACHTVPLGMHLWRLHAETVQRLIDQTGQIVYKEIEHAVYAV